MSHALKLGKGPLEPMTSRVGCCVSQQSKKPGSFGYMVATWLIKKKPHCLKSNAALSVVPGAGLEPARLAAGDFESPESTNFTTRAVIGGSALWHTRRGLFR